MIDRLPSRVAPVVTPGMSIATAPPPASANAIDDKNSDLKRVAGQLEGLFVQQLFKAMRDTVPQEEGIVSGGSGEEIFTSLMDEHLAAETPRHWEGSLAAALYRQLQSLAATSGAAALPTNTDLSAL